MILSNGGDIEVKDVVMVRAGMNKYQAKVIAIGKNTATYAHACLLLFSEMNV